MHSASAFAYSSITGLGLVEWHVRHYILFLNFYTIYTPFARISTHCTAVLHVIILLLNIQSYCSLTWGWIVMGL
jgi:hypothetical protein